MVKETKIKLYCSAIHAHQIGQKFKSLATRNKYSHTLLFKGSNSGLWTNLAIPNKTTCYFSLFTEIPFLGIYFEYNTTTIQKINRHRIIYYWINCYQTTLETSKCFSTELCLNKLWYMSIKKFFAVKKDKRQL